ncbi:hypothetical protein [Pseudomonas citronellolis]|uniref:hypothetical protein n=1 Tax=Pseudomonas citronellolis TaxID=53408 RepID=UPI001065FD61|nr:MULTISPECIES: hypothetical protein [Pseudomonas]WRT82226.1 hypothetical protein VK748_27930 [Pseudomonas citronellolis]
MGSLLQVEDGAACARRAAAQAALHKPCPAWKAGFSGLRRDSALLRGQFVDSLLLAEQRAVGGGL